MKHRRKSNKKARKRSFLKQSWKLNKVWYFKKNHLRAKREKLYHLEDYYV